MSFRAQVATKAAPFVLPKMPAWPLPDRALEAQQRAQVVAEAVDFIGTAYHHRGTIKRRGNDRGGVDCAWFPYLVYSGCGLAPPGLDLGEYPPDWFLHQGAERYLPWVKVLSREVEAPQMGDFVLYKVGRLFAHGAIVIDWPGRIVHAVKDAGGVILADGQQGSLGGRERLFFSVWGR